MKIISWNVNGIRARLKNNNGINFNDYDIICLQEIKIQDDQIINLIKENSNLFNNFNYYNNGGKKKGQSGVLIFTKIKPINIDINLGNQLFDEEGRIINLEFDNYYLINCYVPNSGQKLKRLNFRKKWDQYLRIYIKILQEKNPIILCGDLNVIHHNIDIYDNNKMNKKHIAGCTILEEKNFDKLLSIGLKDVFRELYPNEKSFSYFNYNTKNGWRLDYFIISNILMKNIKSIKYLTDLGTSDHIPLLLEL